MKSRVLLFIFISLISLSCSKKFLGFNVGNTSEEELMVDEVDFNYFTGKAKLNFEDDEYNIKAKANIRIKKDSLIWMNFTAVGIPGGRCLINQDSIVILNILKKEYYVFTFEDLSKRFNFNVNFEMFQATIFGNLLLGRLENETISKQNKKYLLHQEVENLSIDNTIGSMSRKVEKIGLTEKETKNTLTIIYSDFQNVQEEIFPFSELITLIYNTPNGLVNTKIQISYSKAEIADKELKFPFNIPKKYERK